MQAATHLAGAALTLAVARGFDMGVGPFEVGAMMLDSLLPDIDTTTAGAGRYIRPVSSWIESKCGHRTVTHSLLFAVLVSLPFWLLWPGVGLALFLGVFSHLLLDTANVNGLPYLLWPVRHTFWFLPSRRSRVRYGSSQETTLAVVLALSGVALWPMFSTEVRRLIASPETAVVDYSNWRDTNEVYAQLDGFNSDTQEKVNGRYRVIEALGRRGVLVEDDAGNAYQVAENGQIVAYRVRVQKGQPLAALDSRVTVGGRLLRDVLAAVPADTRVYFTGELQLSAPVNIPPAQAGTFARIAGTDRLTLHSARPADLTPFAASNVVAGSLVVRLSGSAGRSGVLPGVRSRREADLSFELPAEASRTEARTVTLSGLPSLAGLLVERGTSVLEGQPLARYVDAAALSDLAAQIESKQAARKNALDAMERARLAYEQQRDTITRLLSPAREDAARFEKLAAQDAEPRATAQAARARADAIDDQLMALSVTYSGAAADARARAASLALDVQALTDKRARSAAAQVVRSPVAGRVAEVRVKDATQAGVSVDVVIVSTLAAAPTPPVKASSFY